MKTRIKYVLLNLLIICTFFGCDNFTQGSSLSEQVNDEINKANAKIISVRVDADEGFGKTFPSGETSFKLGYAEPVTFEENSAYVFLKWKAYTVIKDNEIEKEVEFTDIEFSSPFNLSTEIKILKASDSQIKIKPVCVEKPYISSSYPQYPKDNVVSPRSSITIAFTTPEGTSIENDSFFYTLSEQSELQNKNNTIEFLKNTNNEVYGYILNNEVYFKNIEITSENYSILANFGSPKLKNNVLTIPINTENPVNVENKDYKDISVSILSDVYVELDSGKKLTLNSAKNNSWNYRVSNSKATEDPVRISFASTNNNGKLTPYETATYYVGNQINLSFEPNDNYEFIEWVSTNNSVTFAKSTQKNTTATIVSSSEDTITAYCVPKLAVDTVSPDGSATSYPKDSSIVVTFNNTLSTLNDLTQIKIFVDNVLNKDNYLSPKISNNSVIIESNPDNPIAVTSGTTKKVKVLIPADFYYSLDESQDISMKEDFEFSFSINEKTVDSAEITFSVNTLIASVMPAGKDNYYIGQTFTCSADMTENYKFLGWKIKAAGKTYEYDGSSLDKSISVKNSSGKVCFVMNDATAASTSISVYDSITGAEITPLYEKIKEVTIKTSSTKGNITAPATCKEGSSFNLAFTAYNDYSFDHWQIVVNGSTLNTSAAAKYISLDTKKAETEVKVISVPTTGSITLNPVCNDRPKVISYTPTYKTEGDYRDTRIKIIFDSEMDLSSFFWTKDELDNMNITEDAGYKLKKAGKTNLNGTDLYYAYYLNNDEINTLSYKNITIKDRAKDTNLSSYFQEPFFETSENKVLVLPAKTGETDSVPSNTDVYVKISKAPVNKDQVAMANETSWCYFVGLKYDNVEPTLSVTKIESVYNSSNKTVSSTVKSDASYLSDLLSKNYTRTDGKINLTGTVNDDGSRPASLEIKLTKVKDLTTGASASSSKILTKALSSAGNEAKFTYANLDISSLFTGDGVYQITVTGYDNNSNASTPQSFNYIYYDETKPSVPEFVETYALDSGYVVKWKYDTKDADLYKVTVTSDDGTAITSTINNSAITNGIIITSKITGVSANGKLCKVTFTVTDIAGNTSSISENEYSGAALGMYYYQTSKTEMKYSYHIWNQNKANINGIVAKVKDDKKSGIIMGLNYSPNKLLRAEASTWAGSQFYGNGSVSSITKLDDFDGMNSARAKLGCGGVYADGKWYEYFWTSKYGNSVDSGPFTYVTNYYGKTEQWDNDVNEQFYVYPFYEFTMTSN